MPSEPCKYACAAFPNCGCEVEALSAPITAADIDLAATYRHSGGKSYTVLGFFKHPKWKQTDYVVGQEYGNYNNPIALFKLENWSAEFSLAWKGLKLCNLCGFMRMSPCKVRQTCASLDMP